MIIFYVALWKNLDSLLIWYFIKLYINMVKIYAGKEGDLFDFDEFTIL
jgi:hypothetical protein